MINCEDMLLYKVKILHPGYVKVQGKRFLYSRKYIEADWTFQVF